MCSSFPLAYTQFEYPLFPHGNCISQAKNKSTIFLCMQVAGKELNCVSLRPADARFTSMVARACIVLHTAAEASTAAMALGDQNAKKVEKNLCHVSNKGG